MSDDPETARQIAELARDSRPLLVLDVDDVILEFIRPFPRFLAAKGYALGMETFRLHGNVTEIDTGAVADRETVSGLLGAFFAAQAEWQTMAAGASEALETLSAGAEIVLLTAMPHRHRAVRRAHLEALGLTYPLLTTEMAKGPAIAARRGDGGRPVAVVDDLPHNWSSARDRGSDAP
ncbi:MAG: hypothetical protein RIM80_19890, partial [Alphaproteobacteria bacterium]